MVPRLLATISRDNSAENREHQACARSAGARQKRSASLLRSAGVPQRLRFQPIIIRFAKVCFSRTAPERPRDPSNFSHWQSGKPCSSISLPIATSHPLSANPAQEILLPALAFLGVLPKRFAERWLDLHVPQTWTNPDLDKLERQVHEWAIRPAATEGYEKAEVTAGGVDTDELSSKTMESRKVRGLFFIGEVVDVTGHLGGFNFQWAWASGAAAGRAL
jgi:hypothetical protein